MSNIFGFGEKVDGYDVPVLNEREVRAGAGILFFFAMIAFMNAWLMGNFRITKIFVIAFLIDFGIRILVNPKFSPSMIVGRLAVRSQAPEYVGARQKRFAWSIGLALALAMLFLVVINNVIGPLNLIICSACLTLLFFEAAFGICLACKIHNLVFREQAKLCPGDACAVGERRAIRKIGYAPLAIVAVFLSLIGFVSQGLIPPTVAVAPASPPGATNDAGCTPPDWAVAMGHAEMWKLHHNCK